MRPGFIGATHYRPGQRNRAVAQLATGPVYVAAAASLGGVAGSLHVDGWDTERAALGGVFYPCRLRYPRGLRLNRTSMALWHWATLNRSRCSKRCLGIALCSVCDGSAIPLHGLRREILSLAEIECSGDQLSWLHELHPDLRTHAPSTPAAAPRNHRSHPRRAQPAPNFIPGIAPRSGASLSHLVTRSILTHPASRRYCDSSTPFISPSSSGSVGPSSL